MSAYGFALAFFFVVLWAQEVATVMLRLAAAAIIVGGSLWVYHNPNAALVPLGIFALFAWPIILGWAIYLPLCWWHGVKPRAPWKPWLPLKQHEPSRRQRTGRLSKSVLAKARRTFPSDALTTSSLPV